jgi:hypothetical protein
MVWAVLGIVAFYLFVGATMARMTTANSKPVSGGWKTAIFLLWPIFALAATVNVWRAGK